VARNGEEFPEIHILCGEADDAVAAEQVVDAISERTADCERYDDAHGNREASTKMRRHDRLGVDLRPEFAKRAHPPTPEEDDGEDDPTRALGTVDCAYDGKRFSSVEAVTGGRVRAEDDESVVAETGDGEDECAIGGVES